MSDPTFHRLIGNGLLRKPTMGCTCASASSVRSFGKRTPASLAPFGGVAKRSMKVVIAPARHGLEVIEVASMALLAPMSSTIVDVGNLCRDELAGGAA